MADNSVPANTLTIGQSQATNLQQFSFGALANNVSTGLSNFNTNLNTNLTNLNAPPKANTDDAPKATSNSGVGAGTTNNAITSVGSDNNPGPNSVATQQALAVFSTANPNQLIPTQPNQLDQYASYTYSISWYLLSEAQFKTMATTQQANVTGWQLLMQSAGAPVKGRNPAFPVDYYMDDLEISSKIWGGGKNAPNNAVDIKFRVTEPNGITLIQSLFNAVKAVYSATPTTSSTANAPNYLTAQYCLVIQFYGYDSTGKLVAPAKGTYSTNSSTSGYGQTAVITKYYPFTLTDIKFTVANKAIEYSIFGKPIPMKYNSSTDRGTIPHPFTMTGQTVNQLLNGKPITTQADSNTVDQGARKTTPEPPVSPGLPTNPNITTQAQQLQQFGVVDSYSTQAGIY